MSEAKCDMSPHRVRDEHRYTTSERPIHDLCQVGQVGIEGTDVAALGVRNLALGSPLSAPIHSPNLEAACDQVLRDLEVLVDRLVSAGTDQASSFGD